MAESKSSFPPADVISDTPELSLDEACAACGLTPAEIETYVQEGIAGVEGPAFGWRFSRLTVVRLRRARRLERDLGLNPAGAVLALELLAEIERLRRRLAPFDEKG